MVSFLVVGPSEELAKLLVVWFTVYRTSQFREPRDGIVYAVTASLGFATVENLIVSAMTEEAFVHGSQIVALIKRVGLATPAHVMFSIMWGYSLGLARFQKEDEISTVLKGYLLGSVLHGAYNGLVAYRGGEASLRLLPLMMFMLALSFWKVRRLWRSTPYQILGEGPLIECPACGAFTEEQGSRCSRCGTRLPIMESDAPRYCGTCRAELDPCRSTCGNCGAPVSLNRLCPPAR